MYAHENFNGAAMTTLSLDDLRKTLDFDNVYPVYQPLINLESGGISSFESLARAFWNKDTLQPLSFLPISETDIETAVRLNRMIIRKVLEDLFTLNTYMHVEMSVPCPAVSINMSPVALSADTGLGTYIQEMMRNNSIAPDQISIEVVEDGAIEMEMSKTAYRSLRAIERHGIKIVQDDHRGIRRDFIRTLALESLARVVKLDMSLLEDPDRFSSTASALHYQGYDIVAEGIETQEHLDLARKAKIQVGQGFGFSRPVPLHQLKSQLFAQNGLVFISGVLSHAFEQKNSEATLLIPQR